MYLRKLTDKRVIICKESYNLYRIQINSNIKTGNIEINWALAVTINKQKHCNYTYFVDTTTVLLTEDKENGMHSQGHWPNIIWKSQSWGDLLMPVNRACRLPVLKMPVKEPPLYQDKLHCNNLSPRFSKYNYLKYLSTILPKHQLKYYKINFVKLQKRYISQTNFFYWDL